MKSETVGKGVSGERECWKVKVMGRVRERGKEGKGETVEGERWEE